MVEGKQKGPSDYALRLLSALKASAKSDTELAAHLGVSIQALRKLWRGGSRALTSENNAKAALFTGVNSDWLATGVGHRDPVEAFLAAGKTLQIPRAPQAQSLSLPKHTVPNHFEWGELMTTKAEELPDIFTSEAPDNAVAPFANEGEMIVFDRTAKPKFKDGVLVRDRAGHYHLRIYAQGQNGRWRATSTSDAFLSFEEEADGLQLIAKAVYVRKPFGE